MADEAVHVMAYPPIVNEPRQITFVTPLPPEQIELLEHCRTFRLEERRQVLQDLMHPELGRDIWLTVRKLPADYVLCHWPYSRVEAPNHKISVNEGDEHRYRKDYLAMRGVELGYPAEKERRVRRGIRTVSDVIIRGDVTLAAEVDCRGESLDEALRKARVTSDTVTPVWFSDHRDPAYAFRVPHIITNERQGMARGQWTVATGPRELEWVHCRPGSDMECPDGPNWCYRKHLRARPKRFVTVDDIVELVPAGELRRLDIGYKGEPRIVLMTPQDCERWLSEHQVQPLAPRQQRKHRWGDPAVSHNAKYLPNPQATPQATPQTAAPTAQLRPVTSEKMCLDCGQKPPSVGFLTCKKCFYFPGRFR